MKEIGSTRIAGIPNAFKPISNGVQKIVSLSITPIKYMYHATNSATTTLSEVRKRIGCPMHIDASVVPPTI